MTGYIYCYENKINHKKYIGQTNNIKRRFIEHKSVAYNQKSAAYNCLLHKAIRKYGIENFNFSVLLELKNCTQEQLDQAEKEYIIKYHTLYSDYGYNLSNGGQGYNKQSCLSEKNAKIIKKMILQGVSYTEIQKIFNISKTFLSNINYGKAFYDNKNTYPLYQYGLDNSVYDILIEELEKPEKTFKQIANDLQICESTVKKFNYGKLKPGYYKGTYPIRKITPYEYKAQMIIDLLSNSVLSKKDIVKITDSSDETVRRINLGMVHHSDDITYPIR